MKGRIFYWMVFSILFLSSITGCQTTKLVPVYTMPTAPANLLAPLPDLQSIKKPGDPNAK